MSGYLNNEGKEMLEKGYNGWTNYETWNVALWLDNERANYEYWRERASVLDIGKLSQELAETIKDNAPDLGSSTYADLLNGALSEVNWYEIAEHLKEQ